MNEGDLQGPKAPQYLNMTDQINLQQKFEDILAKDFSQLQPINKWKQTMWHLDGNLVVSLVHLSKKSKFCFFNNSNLEVGTIQRWGSTTYSNNVEVTSAVNVDWDQISRFIKETSEVSKTSDV